MGVAERYKKNQTSNAEQTLYNGVENRYSINSGIVKDIENRVNTWLQNNNNFIENAKYRLQNRGGYVADSGEWLSTITTQKNNFDREAESIKSLLNQYKDVLNPEWVSSISSVFDSNGKTQADIVAGFTEENSYWNQFENEDVYNEWVAWEQRQKFLLHLDVDAAKKQAETLETALKQGEDLQYKRAELVTLKTQAERDMQYKAKAGWDVSHDKGLIADYDAQIAELDRQMNEFGATYGSSGKFDLGLLKNQAAKLREDAKYAEYKQTGERLTKEALSAPDFETKNRYTNFDTSNDAFGRGGEAYLRMMINDKEVYENMTEEQKKVFGYYLADGTAEGTQTAYDYLYAIEEEVNSKIKLGIVEETDTALEKLLFSLSAGADQFKSGVEGFFNALIGEDRYQPASATQMASAEIRQGIEKGEGFGNWLLGVGYDLGSTGANMLPSILVGTLNPVAGTAVMGVSAGGNAYNEMINLGYDKNQARAYGVMVGASEALLEKALGGMSAFGGGGAKLTTKMLSKVDNALARWAIQTGGSMISEFTEESLQTILEPWFKSIVTGADYDAPDIDEVLYSGLLGALSAGMLEGGGNAINAGVTTYRGSKVKKADGAVEKLKKLGTSFSADSVASQLAGRVTNESGAYTIGRLFQEVGATLSAQNKSDIIIGLTKRGVDESSAKKIANTYEAFLNGEMSLTDEQVRTLEGLDPLNDVLKKNIIGVNTDVYQRTREYSDILDLISNKETKTEIPSVLEAETAKAPQSVAPYSKEYIDTMAKEFEAMGMPAKHARITAQSNLSEPTQDNVSPTEENAVQSQYEVSADGKTINTKSGEIANIKNIESISSNGDVNLTIDDGMVVKASDLSFGTDAEGIIIGNIGKIKIGKNPISTTSANALYMTAMSALESNPNMTADEAMSLIKGLEESYVYGTYNLGRSKLTARNEDGSARLYAGELSQAHRKYAYELGTKDAVSKTETDQKVIDDLKAKAEGKTAKKSLGKVIFEKGAEVADESALTDTQRANLNGIKLLAEISSVEFHVFQSDKANKYKYTMPDGAVTNANGWFVAGTNQIWIDLNAGNSGEGAMVRTAAHEISHYIKEWSPQKWRAMADMLMEEFAKNGVDTESMLNKQIAKIKRRYNKNNMPSQPRLLDMAYEELVSDALSDMLTDGSIVNFIAEVKAKDSSLGKKIINAIKNLLKKWRLIIDSYKGRDLDTAEAQALSQFEDTFKKLQEMYRDAFMDANETVALVNDIVKIDADSESVSPMMSERDSNGDKLSKGQQEYFKDSKVRDANGNLLVVHHGTRNANFTVFNRNINFFTDSAEMADTYSPNGESFTGYLNIVNPYVIDAKGAKWSGVPIDAETKKFLDKCGASTFKEGGKWRTTPADIAYAIQDGIDEGELDYDGVIVLNVDDTGGYWKEKDKNIANDYIAFNSNQFKNIDNINPTSDPDIRYSLREDSEGNTLTDEQKEYFKDSKIVDKNGNLLVCYHGTDADFNTFDYNFISQDNKLGFGFYFMAGKKLQYSYKNPLKTYLNITNPLTDTSKKFSKDALSELCDNLGIKFDYDSADYDLDVYERLSYSYTGKTENFLKAVIDILGVDGIISENRSVAVAFSPEQIKLTSNTNPTENPDIRYSFRGENKDSIEVYETSEEIKKLPIKERQKAFLDIMKNEYRGRTAKFIRNGHTYYASFDYKDINKNIYGDKLSDKKGWRAKINVGADGDIFELVENAKYNGSEPERGKNIAAHSGVGYWDYFIKTVQIDNIVFDLIANVRKKSNDQFVYSIQLNENKKIEASPSLGSPKGVLNRMLNASAESVSQDSKSVKRKLSERDTSYMNAINRGDTETAQRMVDEAAREAGYRIKGHHGTGTRFTIFDRGKTSASNDFGQGFYFSSSEFEAERYQKDDTHGDTYNKIYGVAYDNALERIEEMGEDTSDEMLFDRIFNEEFDKELAKRVKDGAVISAYLQMKTPFVVSSSNWITEAEAIEIAKNTMYVDDVPDEIAISDWVHSIKSYAKQHEGKVDTDHFANKMGHSVALTSALIHQGKYDGILDYTVREKFGESSDYRAIALYANKIKDSSPITYDDNGNVIPLSERFNSKNEDIRYSERDTSSSNRAILANALESVAQNDIERNKLAQYNEKISLIEKEEQKLSEIQKKLFTKGAVEPAERKDLQFEAKQISNRINTYDRQLLNLESTTALKNVLNREKALAMKKQKQRDNEYLKQYKEKVAKDKKVLLERNQESRKKAIEGREKTAMRHKIKGVVNDLNNLLLKPSKERHVPEEMRIAVAEALSIVNMDTVDADARVAHYNDLIAKATNPDVIASLTETRDRILNQGNKLAEKLTKLKDAYSMIRDSADDSLKGIYDDVIYSRIESVQKVVGKTPLRNMTLGQLESVYDLYKMVLTTIRDSNKAFAENITMTRLALGSNTFAEIKKGNKARGTIKHPHLEKFLWQNLKPMQAMKTIGSNTLQKLWNNILYGQETFAQDYDEAVKFAKEMKDKHGYEKWDKDKLYSFDSKSGKTMKLTLEQMMSIYAYSKRAQADEHIEYGGIVLNEGVIKVKNKLGKTVEVKVNDSNAYRLDKMQVASIVATLEKVAPGAKAFVDEMQKYLSETMGEKGNEVAMKMYGIKLFKEEHYLPLKSSKDFMEAANAKLKGDVKIKNKGMTKSTVEHARNPIVLENFLDVWGNHINEMAMYHGLVLPLEDFSRTVNYSFKADDQLNTDAESVRTALHDAFGDNADNYLNELLKAINGGVLHDSSAQFADRMISKFKKSKVMASLSVIVQQPTAIIRAMSTIEPKYFVAQNFNHKATWEELKKYCPTAIIKETGSFDTNMGRTIVDMIKDDRGFTDKVGDVLGKAPAYMDEMGWNMIWRALKKKVATEQNLSGEALLRECGKQMTLILNETQVYDSVMSRNELMRSKSAFTKMATAFMGEPTTVANMIYGAALDFKRGKKGVAGKAVAATLASVVINSLVSAIVYAMRDDDEEKTFLEKYISSATTEVADGLNPLTYIPFVKDAYSLFQGYDVERTDMALVGDVVDAINDFYTALDPEEYEGMSEEETAKHIYENSVPLLTAICDMFGLPVGNVLRDAEAIIVQDNAPMSQTSPTGTLNAFKEGILSSLPQIVSKVIGTESKQDQLYDAIVNGDTAYIERLKSGYKDEASYETAVRKALRENDERIKEAAEAYNEGDIRERDRILDEIVAEGFFDEDLVASAITAEANALKTDTEEETETEEEKKATSIYKADDVNVALENGDKELALEIIDDLVKTKVENGMEEDKAKSSVKSSVTSYWKPLYKAAYKNKDNEEMTRIRKLLFDSGLYGRASQVSETCRDWIKELAKEKK